MDLVAEQKIVQNWLGSFHCNENPWKLAFIEKVGRGLIATRDIAVNELILREPPLIIGPVGNDKSSVICALCFKLISTADVCSNCLLSVCSGCLEKGHHEEECSFLKSLSLNTTESSQQLDRCLTIARGLFLDKSKKNILNLMQCNCNNETENMIDNLLKQAHHKNGKLRNELVRTAAVFNTNAFQIVVNLSSERKTDLRGLYPLMGLINHSCSANCRYSTDSNYIMSLYARKPIRIGQEIVISYAKMLWSTPSRQSYLKITKQFTCKCDRCNDPTEGSTYLSALKCFRHTCSGLLLPVDPINFYSAWKCSICSDLSDYRRILRMQEVVSCMVDAIESNKSAQEIDEFINNRLLKVLPASNQYVVEMKMKIISFNLKDRPINHCELVEKYCLDVLQLLEKLQAGECTLKGIIQYKLFQCRQLIANTRKYSKSEIESSQRKLLMNAWSILKDNIVAPIDLSNTIENWSL
ncbi:SET domain-containing protein SmydA-8, isoform B [Pseudolycoriella hygida]|uniref:SET domain-containing protein SmydA-8, isoform B n=1 Tax=Pseudolycoriella hygida TaxID=35572 RepID=A0A9Q0RYS5_9DIPT|nr:SET domain-containing protein SmydA-8, isoform B [Pseudolycoriella hygida]